MVKDKIFFWKSNTIYTVAFDFHTKTKLDIYYYRCTRNSKNNHELVHNIWCIYVLYIILKP